MLIILVILHVAVQRFNAVCFANYSFVNNDVEVRRN